MSPRTRFAPSPTGSLHVGSLRTALYAYYVARQKHGEFLLRIEDTDQEREVPGAVEALVRTFRRLGIDYDEGPILNAQELLEEKGAYGPYTQSKRLDVYKKCADELVVAHRAYPCFCSKEWLETMRAEQMAAKCPMGHIGPCRPEATKSERPVIRFRMPHQGFTETMDAIRGPVRFPNQDQEDFILMKSDGFPTYHLAHVVDDHLMKISHVIRGEEWLSSLPKHYQLYQAFGWDMPVFAHLPVIVNPDRSKLSKRQGDVAVEDFLAKGYLPEALNNFISLIGYNPKGDQEIYTKEEMIRLFDLSKVNSGNGLFDRKKLNWMNQQYIQHKTPSALAELAWPFLEKAGMIANPSLLEKICAVEKSRLTTLMEIPEAYASYESLSYDPSLLVWKKSDAADARNNLQAMSDFLGKQDARIFENPGTLEKEILAFMTANNLQKGNVLWPVRVALSGRAASPSPFELAWVLGREESLKRLAKGIDGLR